MKKKHILLLAAGILLTLIAIKLSFNFIYNEFLILRYDHGNLDGNDNAIIYSGNFFEPYIAHYNNGNVFYQKKNYDRAINEYYEALKLWPTEEKECKIRINLVLAILNRYDWSGETIVDADTLLEDLYLGRNILMEKGCADDFGKGHDPEAQQLKDDIDKLINELQEQMNNPDNDQSGGSSQGDTPQGGQKNGDDPDEGSGDENKDSDDGGAKSREDEIRDALDEYKQQSDEQRQKNLQDAEEYENGMKFDNWEDKIW